MPQTEMYDDPMADTRQQLLQGLATMATVGEAAARWATVGIQDKAAAREREAQQDQAKTAARREADALAAKVRGEREKMAAAMDGDWLVNKANFAEAAAVWRTAAVHATSGDPVAARAMSFAEQRLHRIRPDLMQEYDRHRHAGVPLAEAMRRAAVHVWHTDTANGLPSGRPHGNTRDRDAIAPTPPALPAGGQPLNDLDTAVRAEALRLAEHIDPAALDELQQRWRATGKLPPDDPTRLLAALATEMREAAAAGGTDGHTTEAFHRAADGVDQALDRAAAQTTAPQPGQDAEPAEPAEPDALERVRQQWLSTGRLPTDDPAALQALAAEMRAHGFPGAADEVAQAMVRDLEGRAAAERSEGVHDAGSTDNPRTVTDEHTDGQVNSVTHDDNADHTAATAAAVQHGQTRPASTAAQAFPHPLRVPQNPGHTVAAQPAQAATAAATRSRGTAR